MSSESRFLSVSYMPLEHRWATIEYTAVLSDELGYDTFGLPETWAYDVPVLLSNLARQTKQVKLSAGIVGVWSRTAAAIAMAAAAMQMVSDGRFVLGLGASTPQLVEGLHDIPFENPLLQLRQVITQIGALLAQERVPLYQMREARALRLNLSPQPRIPILLGAASPASIRLAGELCDGWLPFLFPRGHLGEGIELLNQGRQKSESEHKSVPNVMASVPTIVDADESKARVGAAWFVAFYITSMGTLYRESLRRMGFGDEVDSVLAANKDRRPGIVPPEADNLLDQLVIYGTPEQAQERLNLWYDAGTDNVSLLLSPNLEEAHIKFTLEAFEPQG